MKKPSPMRWKLLSMPLHDAYLKVEASLRDHLVGAAVLETFERVGHFVRGIRFIVKEKVSPRLS